MDIIFFKVQDNVYSIATDNLERILKVPEITDVVGMPEYCEGMFSHFGDIINIISMRSILRLPNYADELLLLFKELKGQHTAWVEALKTTVYNGTVFTKTTDQHACELGKWLDSFISYDDYVSKVLKELNESHKKLHKSAITILELQETSHEAAKEYFEVNVLEIYQHTIGEIDEFIGHFHTVSNSLQMLLIYKEDDERIALLIDEIIDIKHYDDDAHIQPLDKSDEDKNDVIDFSGIIDIDSSLSTHIGSINLQAINGVSSI